jgi:hypothetical protein
MKLKLALAGVLLAGFILPAAAQGLSFYVVQDPSTKHCQVVDVKPTTTETTTIGGDGQVYKTRTEAEGAMGTATVCSR